MRFATLRDHGAPRLASTLAIVSILAATAAQADDSAMAGLGAPIGTATLETQRGGADIKVLNANNLDGTASNNSATNVVTGNNVITGGSFSGTVGVPIVVQNSGNNVLIQNATIINLQMK